MRRKDREKSAEFALEVLRGCEYAVLATINADKKTPYCIAISPVLVGNAIYFHCANEGQKLDNIKQNNNVCVTCVQNTKLIPEQFATEYESAVAVGKCVIVSDENKTEKIMALRAICEKYAKSNMHNFDGATAGSLPCICRIDIEQITGKARYVES